MKIKMQVANGSAVYTMKGEEDTKENRYGTDC